MAQLGGRSKESRSIRLLRRKGDVIRPFADGNVRGDGQIAQYYDIGSNDQDRAAEEREKWRQVSHAWAARLMEGVGEKAQNYQKRLQQAGEEAVYREQCKTEGEMHRCIENVKRIFSEQERKQKEQIQNVSAAA